MALMNTEGHIGCFSLNGGDCCAQVCTHAMYGKPCNMQTKCLPDVSSKHLVTSGLSWLA